MKIITTSWDDGAMEDFKLAEILNKYNLEATFYIPQKNSERPVISVAQIRDLASVFEIGGHTLNHVFLTTVSPKIRWQEIEGCFNWLNEIIGVAPASFCAPKGLYADEILQMVKKSGFKLLRTTHLLNIKGVSNNSILPLLHTTVQMYEHTMVTYCKHLMKRRKIATLISWLLMHSETELLNLIEKQLHLIRKNQVGVFHLWGHSWEIDEYNLWNKLEAVCNLLSKQNDFIYMKNNQIIT